MRFGKNWGRLGMRYELSSLCYYAKGKISIDSLSKRNYISTENIMPNKGGIVDASNLPSVQYTQRYVKGDILVSNIRPYFKKIWMAENDGGCSNDILVFRAMPECDPTFLYYVLANDAFFDYAMATSKGTKMPRGDKIAIMEYEVPCLDHKIQLRIGQLLRSIDKRITVNKMINDNLTDLLQMIYQERFGHTSLVANQGTLSDICSYSRDKVAVSELNISTYFSTENMLSGKAGSTEATSLPTTPQTTACHKGDTLISNIRPYFKKIVYCEDACGCSTDVLCFTPNQPQYSAYLFSTLYADKFFAFMVAGSKGTKMPRGDKQQIMTYPVILPSEKELVGFNAIASPLLEQIYSNRAENKRLSILRDTLLPKLMSGEIDVSAVQL